MLGVSPVWWNLGDIRMSLSEDIIGFSKQKCFGVQPISPRMGSNHNQRFDLPGYMVDTGFVTSKILLGDLWCTCHPRHCWVVDSLRYAFYIFSWQFVLKQKTFDIEFQIFHNISKSSETNLTGCALRWWASLRIGQFGVGGSASWFEKQKTVSQSADQNKTFVMEAFEAVLTADFRGP